MSLSTMNKQMKIYLNEASGISDKCKLKLVKLVEKHFLVDLPNENYLNIDIEILGNGNIKMRDVEYRTQDNVSDEALEKRFNDFQVEAEALLEKNEVNFDTISKKNGRANLVIASFISFIIFIVVEYALSKILSGDLYGFVWFVIMLSSWVLPKVGTYIKDRYRGAFEYLKSIIYKKRK